MCEEKILVIGIGNILMQDDGIGVYIVNSLKEEKLSLNIDLLDGGSAGFELIDMMEGYRNIYIIDAMSVGMEPGKLCIFSPAQVKDKKFHGGSSLHGLGLLEMLKVADIIGKSFNICLIGIEAKSINYGIGLSNKLKNKLPETVSLIKNLISKKHL